MNADKRSLHIPAATTRSSDITRTRGRSRANSPAVHRVFQFRLGPLFVAVAGIALGLAIGEQSRTWLDGMIAGASFLVAWGLLLQSRDLWRARGQLATGERPLIYGWRFAILWRQIIALIIFWELDRLFVGNRWCRPFLLDGRLGRVSNFGVLLSPGLLSLRSHRCLIQFAMDQLAAISAKRSAAHTRSGMGCRRRPRNARAGFGDVLGSPWPHRNQRH